MGHDVVPIAGMLTGICIVVGLPLVRAYARKIELQPRGGNALPSGEIVTRLDRIEQAVEAISTEVERISEGQRFTTKLLSEGRPSALQPVAAPTSVIAPTPAQTGRPSDGTVLVEAARRNT